MEDESIDWEAKYESIHKSFEDLKSLRKKSVLADLEVLQRQIDEHEKIHRITVAELKRQNEQMKNIMKQIPEMKQKITKSQANIQKLKSEIGKKDKLLHRIFQYSCIRLLGIDNYTYEFETIAIHPLRFQLQKNGSNYRYTPIGSFDSEYYPEDLSKVIQFSANDLSRFCDLVEKNVDDMERNV